MTLKVRMIADSLTLIQVYLLLPSAFHSRIWWFGIFFGYYYFFITIYYMALCHNDWELPNSRIWLAEMDIDRRLDFPI